MAESSTTDTLGKIAVIGMAGRYPDAWNVEQFWQHVKEGRECITFFKDDELLQAGVGRELLSHPDYVKARGVCPGIFLFDAAFFGYTPREAELMDPQQRVFLECAWEALENAGYDALSYSGRIGLFAGSGASQYLLELLSVPGIDRLTDGFTLATLNEKDYLTSRVGYKLDLRGPCVTVQTACSTSLVSIVMACQSLLSFQSDIALGGGVTLIARQRGGHLYQEGGIHSRDGHCRAFDADAQGIVGGEGAGVAVLKRLEDALADRDNIYAVILGAAINNDGCSRIGFSAPGVSGQVAVSSDAIAMAGINPETIGYVECHGTATPLGDPIEITALTKSFRAYTSRKNYCAVGSVKTNVGHTDAAAGVAGFTKAVLALKNKVIPASLHFRSPNPEIDFANSPFYVSTSLMEWKSGETPRRAGVNSFGLGGTNAHVVLEEAPFRETSSRTRDWNLLVWSARTEPALAAMETNLCRHLELHPELNISDVAFTLQSGRRLFPHRKALVCKGSEELLSPSTPAKVYSAFRMKEPPLVTFLFSGQGAQYVNMGRELYLQIPFFREQIERCAEILKHEMDLLELLYPDAEKMEGSSRKLEQVRYVLPAIFTIEYALAKLWIEWGVHPESMIGHSMGEFAAACISGVFSLEDALQLVTARGKLIQQLPAGAMTGVMLSEQELMPLLASFPDLSIAVVNLPSTCVVAGQIASMEKLESQLSDKGVPYRRLHIHRAVHSKMMDPILDDFRLEVQKVRLNPPKIPYLSNLTRTWITPGESTSPDYWVRHLRETVHFSDALSVLLRTPGRMFLEIGPGHMLTSLVGQHPARSSEHTTVSSLPHPKNDPQTDLELLLSSLGQIWLQGVRINWDRYHAGEPCHRLALPGYPFERQHYQLTAARSQSAGRVAEQHPASAGTRNVQPSAGTRNVQRDDTDQNSPAVLGGKHPRPNLPVQYVAPRNELEQAIARIWQETLGIDQPGINDNFVALGGHSLLAIQVATRMRETFEIEFSVTSLYRTPTIAGLSAEVVRLLSKDIDADTVEEVIHRGKALKPEDVIQATGMNDKAMDRMAALSPEKFRLLSRETKKKGPISSSPVLEERALSPLVTIRATGPNPPLFLVHPVGGGVVAYHNLAKYLGDQQPVYAFQNLDQNDRDELNPSSIEAMAAHYSDVICNLSIPEPYLLGGSSMGGIVAFEMALQLSSRGREVGLVALLDSPAHIAPLRLGAANELVKFAEIIAGSSSQKLRFSQDDIERAASAEQVSYVLRKLQEQDLISAYLELAAFTSAFNTFTRNLRALEKYTPRNYTGEVVMLRATDESLDMRKTAGEVWDDPSFGWQAFCTRPVTVHFVPGTHIAMNLEPHVQVVGARLQQCINQVLSEKVTA